MSNVTELREHAEAAAAAERPVVIIRIMRILRDVGVGDMTPLSRSQLNTLHDALSWSEQRARDAERVQFFQERLASLRERVSKRQNALGARLVGEIETLVFPDDAGADGVLPLPEPPSALRDVAPSRWLTAARLARARVVLDALSDCTQTYELQLLVRQRQGEWRWPE